MVLTVAAFTLVIAGNSSAQGTSQGTWGYAHNNAPGATSQTTAPRDNTRVQTQTPKTTAQTERDKNKKKIKEAVLGVTLIKALKARQNKD